MFSSRNFIVSGLNIQVFDPLGLIFVHGIRQWSSFIIWRVAVQLSDTICAKTISEELCVLGPFVVS